MRNEIPNGPIRIVIERRGDTPLEWSTEDGLVNVSMAPFGVVGEFEGKEMAQQMVSWYEVSSYSVYDLSDRISRRPILSVCDACGGTGADTTGSWCERCEGFGHAS